jgi:hypothetical protein
MRGRRGDLHALHKGVTEVWEQTDLQDAFSKVWGRLGRVIHLIRDNNGGNKLVESKQGKRWSHLDEPITISDNLQPPRAAAIQEECVDLLDEDDDEEYDDIYPSYLI